MPSPKPVLLLATLLAMGCGPQDQDLRRPAAFSEQTPDSEYLWRYDERAVYHGVLPSAVQEMQSEEPMEVAQAVCRAVGGKLDFIQKETNDRERLGFNCAFFEHDRAMSTEFGELHRIRTNPRRT